jgi:EAL domain-containing protein (putative c-di-GMP-specific phosphodiesterase class I)
MDGIRLLREIRKRDPHVQVILMTGLPSVETAISALDFGALKYLTKPMDLEELKSCVLRAVRLSRIARAESRASVIAGGGHAQVTDLAGFEVSLDRTLDSLWIAYQPILDAGTGAIVGYEALVRSEDRSLPHPTAMLDAAELLGRLPDLGQRIRRRVCEPFDQRSGSELLFVNLHPTDLLDETLFQPSPLSALAPRVVLEITERASLHRIPDAAARVAVLRESGFRIAVDDLGAGYAGLSSFTHLEPEFVKLDVSLVRGIDTSATQRRVVGAITTLAKDLGMAVVAEGIETLGESDVLRGLGCNLLQGFLFAVPGPALPSAKWPYTTQ